MLRAMRFMDKHMEEILNQTSEVDIHIVASFNFAVQVDYKSQNIPMPEINAIIGDQEIRDRIAMLMWSRNANQAPSCQEFVEIVDTTLVSSHSRILLPSQSLIGIRND